MSKKLFLSTTALTFGAAGMMGGPAPAVAADPTFKNVQALTYGQDLVSGYVGAHYGFGTATKFWDDGSRAFDSYRVLGGAGRLNWWLSPGMSVQGDVYGSSFSNKESTFGAAVHLALRDANRGAIGVMGSLGHRSFDRFHTLAVEGQLYMGNITLYGQVGMTGFTDCSGCDRGEYAAFQGRFFLNPDTVLKGDVAFASNVADNSESLFRLGAEIEHKPMGMPVSLYARGMFDTLDTGGGRGRRSSQFMFGVKLFVNEPTLLAGDRRGATFLDLNPTYGDKATKFVWH
jgi:hypothetical protein